MKDDIYDITYQFKSVGKGCKISDKISVYGGDRIVIGDNVRIDDYCILSSGGKGYINIGSHIHIASHSCLYGGSGITMEDFGQFSSAIIYWSESDDFSGYSLVGPCIPVQFKPRYQKGPVHIGRHVLIGAQCVILPGVTIGEGASIGACSMVKYDCTPWMIYAGTPAKAIKRRSREMLKLEQEFLKYWEGLSHD